MKKKSSIFVIRATQIVSTFLSKWLDHTRIFESPTSFWRWGAYGAISAVLRDNCYLKMGGRNLYPNLYILFLAESSGHRKGPPVDKAETLVVKANNTKVISGRTSVQAIMDELARAETDKTTGKVTKTGSAIFFAPELSAGIVSDPAALDILTDIYDMKTNPYKSRLRAGPSFNLDRIVFSMLAASNEDMMKRIFTIEAIKGGMLARTMLITPSEFRPGNSLFGIDEIKLAAEFEDITKTFLEIAKLEGQFAALPDAQLEFNKWYLPFRDSYKAKREASGIIGRIHTSIIKLTMILAANELSLFITKAHMEESIELCLALIPNYSILTMNQLTKNDTQKVGGILLTYLLEKPGYTALRKDVIRDNWQSGVDPDLLEKAAIMLEAAGMLKTTTSLADGIAYMITGSCLEQMGKK